MENLIQVVNRQKRIPVSPSRVRQTVRRILQCERVRQYHLTIVLLTDGQIRKINKSYLDHDYPTDVLSFDMGPGTFPRTRRPYAGALEGEVLVSTGRAVANARAYRTTPWEEVVLYITHGVLHLRGYDDHTPAATRRMRAREQKILDQL